MNNINNNKTSFKRIISCKKNKINMPKIRSKHPNKKKAIHNIRIQIKIKILEKRNNKK